jgi:hypothetical protein
MEKYPNGLPSHFFREPKPKKEKKKKKKRILDIEPPSVKKQIQQAGKSNVSTRSRNGGTDSESGADLTSYDGGDAVSVDLSQTDKSSNI